MTNFVYIVVWGDFSETNCHISNDKFTQYVFDDLSKAQSYVRHCLVQSADALGNDYANIPGTSDIRVDRAYECYNESLCYDYIKIIQYYLM